MRRYLPAGLAAAGVVLMLTGMAGKLPHEWFGLTTADLLGWAIILFLPAVFLVLQVVILDRQRQLKRDMAWIAWRLGSTHPDHGRVVQGPWGRRSG